MIITQNERNIQETFLYTLRQFLDDPNLIIGSNSCYLTNGIIQTPNIYNPELHKKIMNYNGYNEDRKMSHLKRKYLEPITNQIENLKAQSISKRSFDIFNNQRLVIVDQLMEGKGKCIDVINFFSTSKDTFEIIATFRATDIFRRFYMDLLLFRDLGVELESITGRTFTRITCLVPYFFHHNYSLPTTSLMMSNFFPKDKNLPDNTQTVVNKLLSRYPTPEIAATQKLTYLRKYLLHYYKLKDNTNTTE